MNSYLENLVENFPSIFTTIVVLLGALWFFTKLAIEKKINGIFDKQLEDFRAEKARDLAKLSADLETLTSKHRFVEEKRIEALPKLWEAIAEAHALTGSATSLFRQYPDVSKMKDQEIFEFADAQDWSSSSKQFFKDADNKTKALHKIAVTNDLNRAGESLNKLNLILNRLRFFIEPELEETLDEFCKVTKSVLVDHHMNLEDRSGVDLRETRKDQRRLGELYFNAVKISRQSLGLKIKNSEQNLP